MSDHGLLYTNGSYIAFDDPVGVATLPFGINNAGQIVGYYYDSHAGQHGFLANPEPPVLSVALTASFATGGD